MRNQPFSQIDSQEDVPGLRNDPRRRPLILALFIIAVFTVIGVRVAYMQTAVASRYITPWQEFTVEEEEIPCRDGRILSRDGVVLAQDESRYDLSLDYRWLQNPPHPGWIRQQVSQQIPPQYRRDPARRAAVEKQLLQQREDLLANLAEMTGESSAELMSKMSAIQRRIEAMRAAVERRRLARAEQQSPPLDWSSGLTGVWKVLVQELTTAPDRYADDPIVLKEELQDHLLLKNVSREIVAAVQSQPGRFPGVHIRTTSTRSYPHDDLAAHLIGLRKNKPGQVVAGDSHRAGESGIEKFSDAILTGIPGLVQHHRNRTGERVQQQEIRSPTDGRDIVLTIDFRLQELAEEQLDQAVARTGNDELMASSQGATLVAMDVWTGDLLALACSPRPSLRMLIQPTQQEWDQLQGDARHPLFPRTTRMAVAPGSLFKLITATAALEEGFTEPTETLNCRGYLNEPDQYRCLIFRQHGIGHGAVNLPDALSQSCQIYFYEMARRMGPDPICDWAARFGLGESTGIDLPGEHSGKLPLPPAMGLKTSSSATGEKWYPGTTLQLAVGQGALLVTPLQVVRMFAAIANGGYLLSPRVTMTSASEEAEHSHAAPRKIVGLTSETLDTLRSALEQVMQDPRGTGQAARIDQLPMAGLGASAEVKGKPAHVWFAGYAPAQQPRVAFAVVLEHGGNETAAALLARDFVTELLGGGYLRPVQDDRQTSLPADDADGSR